MSRTCTPATGATDEGIDAHGTVNLNSGADREIATSYDSQGRPWRVTVSMAPTITVPAGGFAIVQR